MTLFGTDGVRGPVGQGVFRPQALLRLGLAIARALREDGVQAVAIARDTRQSSPWIASNLASALLAAGIDVEALGVVPTPVLAHHVASHPRLGAGLMVTASHNPFGDNGIKLFSAAGGKVDDRLQSRCETYFAGMGPDDGDTAIRSGTLSRPSVEAQWLESLGAGEPLRGLVLVADGASGAGHTLLVDALRTLGAEVIVSDPSPDGTNINEGRGAVHPEALARRVVAEQAHGGVALDGDGDRVVLVDERGGVHDGDAILGVLAQEGLRKGWLRGGAVVGTVATNGGLEGFLRSLGLRLERTSVGDRYVAERMAAVGANLGGESSGHVLTPDLCPSGDGTRVAVEVLRIAAALGSPLSALLGAIPRFAVEHRKVRTTSRPPIDQVPALVAAIAEAERRLQVRGGRTLVRYSGTEPLLRVQVEGADDGLLPVLADAIAQAAQAAIGVTP